MQPARFVPAIALTLAACTAEPAILGDGQHRIEECEWRQLVNDRIIGETGANAIGMNICPDGQVVDGALEHVGDVVSQEGDRIVINWTAGPVIGEETLTLLQAR